MSDAATTPTPDPPSRSSGDPAADRSAERSDPIELAAALILAIATVIAAWAAYQATRWSGEQANDYSLAAARRTDAAQLTSVLAAQTQIDVQVWLSWMERLSDGDQAAADFIEQRFRDEFRPAFDAWLAQVPAGEVPPDTPFDMAEYRSEVEAEAVRLNAEADALAAEARRANQIADNFVLTAVIMAMVLFFAGVGTRFTGRRVRQAMLALSVAFLVAGVAFTFSMPQNVSL